jgi:hypothetical protein
MSRTTDELVESIIEVDDSIVLTPFIEAANALVTYCCVDTDDYTYTDDILILIETWLAAHFYTVRDPRVFQEGFDSIQATYQVKTDLGLATSHFGQTAMILDPTGALAQHCGKARGAFKNEKSNIKTNVSVTWVGTVDD